MGDSEKNDTTKKIDDSSTNKFKDTPSSSSTTTTTMTTNVENENEKEDDDDAPAPWEDSGSPAPWEEPTSNIVIDSSPDFILGSEDEKGGDVAPWEISPAS